MFLNLELEPGYVEVAIRTVLMIRRAEETGDVLLFLTGEEKGDACRKIKLKAGDFINSNPETVGIVTSTDIVESSWDHVCRRPRVLQENSI